MNTLILRSASGALYVLLFVGTVLSPYPVLFLLFIIALAALAAFELAKMQSKPTYAAVIIALSILTISTQLLGPLWTAGVGAFLASLSLISLRRSFAAPSFYWLFTLAYMSLGIASFYAIYSLGQWVCIGVLIALWTNDSFAYLTGSLIGKTKVSSISPNKSLEGYIGGFVFCIASTLIANELLSLGLSWAQAAVLGALISISAHLGDLVISKLKRIYERKDTGRLIPGHGGIMDRIDSLIFSVPFTYLYLQFVIV